MRILPLFVPLAMTMPLTVTTTEASTGMGAAQTDRCA
jgi:hypothetical protein